MTRNQALAVAIYAWQREVIACDAAAAERATARTLIGPEIRLHGSQAESCARVARARYERAASLTVDDLLDLRDRGHNVHLDQIAQARRRERESNSKETR